MPTQSDPRLRFLVSQGYLAGNKHPVQVPFRRFLHRKLADTVLYVSFLSLNRATTDCSYPHPTLFCVGYCVFLAVRYRFGVNDLTGK